MGRLDNFIPKRFRPFDETKGPWLIWSMHWNCWHRRGESGGAQGYTDDILSAGIFDATIASAYHDTGPPKHRRDVSIPASKALKALAHAVAEKQAEAQQHAARLEALRAALENPTND